MTGPPAALADHALAFSTPPASGGIARGPRLSFVRVERCPRITQPSVPTGPIQNLQSGLLLCAHRYEAISGASCSGRRSWRATTRPLLSRSVITRSGSWATNAWYSLRAMSSRFARFRSARAELGVLKTHNALGNADVIGITSLSKGVPPRRGDGGAAESACGRCRRFEAGAGTAQCFGLALVIVPVRGRRLQHCRRARDEFAGALQALPKQAAGVWIGK
jgi:hypothetical protein